MYWVLCVVISALCTWGFNLDPRIPVIKVGDPGAYFGYSVAQHQSVDEITEVVGNWLLVGAPLGQNLQPNTNQSGAIFKCPITSYRNDCIQVVTDGKRSPLDGLYDKYVGNDDLTGPLDDEIKDGQWLGVTLKSQGKGKKVLVCAHRYIRKGADYRWGQGLCHTLTQYLDYDDTWEPCLGRPTYRAHEQFGYCQAGTSGALLEDDTAIIGTPGPYTWMGTVFAVSISDDFLLRDKTFYYGPFSERDKYSYLGMSVTGGRFFNGTPSYVAGAPRSNGTGQVFFYGKKQTAVSQMQVQLILNGEVFASSYGYEMATADVNGDGLPDLIVGAPFYYGKDEGGAIYVYHNKPEGLTSDATYVKITGTPESRFGFSITNLGDLNQDGYGDIAVGAPYDGNGTVSIFLGSADGIIKEAAQVIRAEDVRGRLPVTFGYSLSGGLDLDHNTYPDLLVGAYDSDEVVFIRARPIINIFTIVGPKDTLTNIDPEKPGCRKHPNAPEVCFTFNACFNLSGSVSNLELNYQIEAETFSGKKFSRVKFEDGLPDRSHVVKRKITLHGGERGKCTEETVYLKEKTVDIQSPIRFKLAYTLIQREPPEVIPGSDLPDVNDYPILNQQEASKIFEATFEKDCGDNIICESNVRLEVKFENLQQEGDQAVLHLGEQHEVVIDLDISNTGESAYEAQMYVTHPRSLSYIGLVSEVNQFSCNPHPYNSTLLVCSLGNPFRNGNGDLKLRFNPAGLLDIESRMEFVFFTNSTSEEIYPQGEVRLSAVVVKKAELRLDGLGSPEQVFYGGVVRGESAMEYLDEIGSRVLHTYEVYNAGPWKVSTLNVFISWPFQVENKKPQGKWLLYLQEEPTVDGDGECYVNHKDINPLNLTNRPGLNEAPLDMSSGRLQELKQRNTPEISETGQKIHYETDVAENEIEDSYIKKKDGSRRKRDTEYIILPEAIVDKDGHKRQVVTMTCDTGTAKCLEFKCVIRNLKETQSAIIKVRARLWNSTFVEDYPKVDSVVIYSKGRIEIPPELEIRQDNLNDIAQAETNAYPALLDQLEPESVPMWIIIVSVLGGILLLVLLVILMWRCGFFERTRPDNTLSGNVKQRPPETNGESS